MERLVVLEYEYVADIVERRGAYREAHLELVRQRHAEGVLRIAGAVGDPPSGALLVFVSEEEAAAFRDATKPADFASRAATELQATGDISPELFKQLSESAQAAADLHQVVGSGLKDAQAYVTDRNAALSAGLATGRVQIAQR